MNSSEVNWWSQHYQSIWRERADDATLPLWLRVASLAYGTHRGNGHANFGPGEIAAILGKPADRVSRALAQAKRKGWLSRESSARCLVVPPHAITGGNGHRREVCAVHVGKRTGRKPAANRPPIAIGSAARTMVTL